MGLFDNFFNKRTEYGVQTLPSKECLTKQISALGILISCFKNSILDDARKTRMVRNMRLFKVTLAFFYEEFKYGQIRDVLSTYEDFEAAAQVGVPLIQLKNSNKTQYKAILQDTLESWESHISAIKAVGLTDNRVQQQKEYIDGIKKTLEYVISKI